MCHLQIERSHDLKLKIKFAKGQLFAQGNQHDASVPGAMYDACPGGEISYSIYHATSKYCFNTASWKSYEECESHSNQCCPGMSLAAEPLC